MKKKKMTTDLPRKSQPLTNVGLAMGLDRVITLDQVDRGVEHIR